MMLGREPSTVVARDEPPLGDRKQRVVRLVVFGARKEGLVGRDQRQIELIGKIDDCRLGLALDVEAVALKRHVEAVAEDGLRVPEAALPRALRHPRRAIG